MSVFQHRLRSAFTLIHDGESKSILHVSLCREEKDSAVLEPAPLNRSQIE